MTQRKAAALGYNPDRDQAPRVLASGRGLTADKLLELAREHSIPMHKDAALVETLLQLEIGLEIPHELYGVIAEILAFVKHLEERVGRRSGGTPF